MEMKNQLTKEFLVKEYLEKDKSAVEISKELGISDYRVIRRIKQYDIPKHKVRLNKKNGMWKGDRVGYHAIHDWIENHKQKSELCENCEKEKSYDLANISGEYKRDINDYKWLCRKCHMIEDGRLKKLHLSNRRKIKEDSYQCSSCKEFKIKEFFSKDKYTADKLYHVCKNCLKIKYKEKKYGTKRM